ncbi:MAG TPA: glutathione S-transferase family protein, partial [Ramlibacter sp.]
APKLWVAPDEPGHAAYLNFVSYGEATLTFPLAVHFRYTQVEPEGRRQPQAAEDYKKFFLGRLKLIEPVLEGQQWLCGARFTAADVSVGFALHFAQILHLDDAFKPQVKDYLRRVQGREAFARAVMKESNA